MTHIENSFEIEINSIQRKSDQACSIHSRLRDRNARYANLLDYGMMAASTYLLGMSLIEPALGVTLSFGFDRQVLIVLLTLALFFLTIVQFKSGWRANEQAHKRSASEYAKVKASCRVALADGKNINEQDCQRIRECYNLIADIGTHIPDAEFASGKAHHKRKVFISKYLDSHPGASVLMIKIKLFLRDNFNINFLV